MIEKIEKLSPLTPWLKRQCSLKPFIDIVNASVNLEYGGFVALDYMMQVDKTVDCSPQSLEDSWRSTREYLEKALEITDYNTEDSSLLDSEEAWMIREELGEPPECCYPLYFIAVGSGKDEKVVYIGMTSSKQNRFKNGHPAITKLHSPKYDGLSKRVYFACVCLLDDDKDYLPLEWIQPETAARGILKSIEAQLIYHYNPELNSINTKAYNALNPTFLHIQNFINDFLNDEMIFPEKDET